jgi:2-succinyl-6-hydroxy-2,4-cyclohexadiene-1-carboxylate synthase
MTALLGLHGFAGSPQAFSRLELPPHVRCYLPLLGGHRDPTSEGEHQAPAPSGFDDEVDRLYSWCQRRGFVRGHLLGYSMGARLALGLLVRYPGLFTSATLIGVHPGLCNAQERVERQRLDRERSAALHERGILNFMAEWETLPLFDSQWRLPEDVLARQAAIRRQHDGAQLAQVLRNCGLGLMPDLSGSLADIAVPVQLVVGALDQPFCTIANQMLERLRNAELHCIPNCGHNPLLEAPETLRALLLPYL